MPDHKYVIAVDWGNSHLRAYLCDASIPHQLVIIAQKNGPGVAKAAIDFKATLLACIAPWLEQYGGLAVFMSGAIGSNIGWQESPYLPCPISPYDVATSCISVDIDDYDIQIAPGLSCVLSNGHHDALRGEETQILGWLMQRDSHRQGQHLLCLPGTHTKWVLVEDGKVKVFKTAITGELYDLLCNGSVLIQQGSEDFDPLAFDQGAKYTLTSEAGNLVHGLFSVRSKQLFGEFNTSQAANYLSGMLIGADVRAALNATEWRVSSFDSVSIIGPEKLDQHFANVLACEGINTTIYDSKEMTIAGFALLIAQQH